MQSRLANPLTLVTDPTDNDSQPVTVIVPGPAEARGGDDAASSRSRSASMRLLIIAVLCLMLLTLVAVIVVLPDLVAERVLDEQKPAPEPPAVTPPAPPSLADAQRLAREKREAENRLGMVLSKQTELEAQGEHPGVVDVITSGRIDDQLQVGLEREAGRDTDLLRDAGEPLIHRPPARRCPHRGRASVRPGLGCRARGASSHFPRRSSADRSP